MSGSEFSGLGERFHRREPSTEVVNGHTASGRHVVVSREDEGSSHDRGYTVCIDGQRVAVLSVDLLRDGGTRVLHLRSGYKVVLPRSIGEPDRTPTLSTPESDEERIEAETGSSTSTKAIWRYEVPVADRFEIEMPEGAEILSVQTQPGPYGSEDVQMWALVDPTNHPVRRVFCLCATGQPLRSLEIWRYLASIQVRRGTLVFHMFEEAGNDDS